MLALAGASTLQVGLIAIAGLVGLFLTIGAILRFRVIKSDRFALIWATASAWAVIGLFWLAIGWAVWWFFFSRDDGEMPTPPVGQIPTSAPPVISSAESAFEAFERAGDVTCADAHALPAREEEPETLICSQVFVDPSDHPWQVTVWIYDDAFFAEQQYREDCEALERDTELLGRDPTGWLVYERGQLWIAIVRDDDFSRPRGNPPRWVGESVADVLGSLPWGNCGAVES
jgi:hypothetical protein